MRGTTTVQVLADVPDISVDQFVRAAAVSEFCQLQGVKATVCVSFQQDFTPSTYRPDLDISFADIPIPAEELIARVRLELFPEGFLSPFCSSLLLGSEHPSRVMLEDHFDQLQQLAFPARHEFEVLDESSQPGPAQRAFYGFANDLLSLISYLIANRVCDPSNERPLRHLLAKLGCKVRR